MAPWRQCPRRSGLGACPPRAPTCRGPRNPRRSCLSWASFLPNALGPVTATAGVSAWPRHGVLRREASLLASCCAMAVYRVVWGWSLWSLAKRCQPVSAGGVETCCVGSARQSPCQWWRILLHCCPSEDAGSLLHGTQVCQGHQLQAREQAVLCCSQPLDVVVAAGLVRKMLRRLSGHFGS